MPSQHDEASGSGGVTGSLLETVDRVTLAERVDPETVQRVVKLLLGAVALVLVLGLVSVLPGVDRVVPETPVSFLGLAVAVVTVVLVWALLDVAHPVEELVYQASAGPDRLRLLTAVIAKHLVVLTAVFVAYRGLAGVVVPFLAVPDAVWLYDVAFLVLATVPTAFIAHYAYRALDPSAAYVTERVLGAGSETATDGTDGALTAHPAGSTGADANEEDR